MRESASCPEISAVERLVDRTARRCLRGEAQLTDWYQVLRQYEETWMLRLDELRRQATDRQAA